MRTPSQIAEFIMNRVERIYERPLMYGETSQSVDTILHYYHELWAMIVGREDYDTIRWQLHSEAGGVAASLTDNYRRSRPDATDKEVVGYVVEQWKKISKELGGAGGRALGDRPLGPLPGQ